MKKFFSAILHFKKPEFITSDKMYIVDKQSGEVVCGAKASPMPSLQWIELPNKYERLAETVEGTVGLYSTRHSSFPIGPLLLEQSGSYVFMCRAENSHAGKRYIVELAVTVIVGML